MGEKTEDRGEKKEDRGQRTEEESALDAIFLQFPNTVSLGLSEYVRMAIVPNRTLEMRFTKQEQMKVRYERTKKTFQA